MGSRQDEGGRVFPREFFECQLQRPPCIEPPSEAVQSVAAALLSYWSGLEHPRFVGTKWLRPQVFTTEAGVPDALDQRSAVLWAIFRLWERQYVRAFALRPDPRRMPSITFRKYTRIKTVPWGEVPDEYRAPIQTNEFLMLQIKDDCWSNWRAGKLNLGEPAESVQPEGATSVQPAGSTRDVRQKKGTAKGEARAKLIAALTLYHQYADGGCLNMEPIGNNQLARLAGVSESTASAFFDKQFKGRTKYREICGDATRLVAALKLLNQEFSPHHLFGAKPPGKDEREDEE